MMTKVVRVTVYNRSVWVLLGILIASGCTDAVPTSDDGNLFPVEARTVEVRLSFDEFASEFNVFGGFGSRAWLPGSVVARTWGGDTDINALVRFEPRPERIFVIPTNSINTVPDSFYTVSSGRLTLWVDSARVQGTPPFELEFGSTQQVWDPVSASWQMAIDTVGGRVPWQEAGGGPVSPAGSMSWDPVIDGDTIMFDLDGPVAAELTDADRMERGLRIVSLNDGSRLRIFTAQLTLFAESTLNPDTLVEITSNAEALTLIYSPEPDLSQEAFQIGGTPARRATFRMTLPDRVDGDALLCAQVPCPMELRPERLVYAALELHSRSTMPAGLQPLDTIGLDVWTTLSPGRLPRSPLGRSVQGTVRPLPPGLFSTETESPLEVSMTRYVADLLRSQTMGQAVTPPVLSVMAGFEPSSLEFGTFWGPGTELGPSLRMIFTLSEGAFLP